MDNHVPTARAPALGKHAGPCEAFLGFRVLGVLRVTYIRPVIEVHVGLLAQQISPMNLQVEHTPSSLYIPVTL